MIGTLKIDGEPDHLAEMNLVARDWRLWANAMPLPCEAGEVMVFEILYGDGDAVWTAGEGKPVEVGTLRGQWRRVMKRAGMSGTRLRPHTMRRTAATPFFRNGGHVIMLKGLLGHRSVKTTEQYVNLAGGDLDPAHAQFGLTASMALSREQTWRSPPEPHVTVFEGFVMRVDSEWTCEEYDWALLDR